MCCLTCALCSQQENGDVLSDLCLVFQQENGDVLSDLCLCVPSRRTAMCCLTCALFPAGER